MPRQSATSHGYRRLGERTATLRGVLSTSEAAALAGLPKDQFRSAMTKERKNGKDFHAPREQWPDGRTPLWDEEKVRAWAKARRKRQKQKKADVALTQPQKGTGDTREDRGAKQGKEIR